MLRPDYPVRILLRRLIELHLAFLRAEVVSLALVVAFCGGLRRLDSHPTDGIGNLGVHWYSPFADHPGDSQMEAGRHLCGSAPPRATTSPLRRRYVRLPQEQPEAGFPSEPGFFPSSFSFSS